MPSWQPDIHTSSQQPAVNKGQHINTNQAHIISVGSQWLTSSPLRVTDAPAAAPESPLGIESSAMRLWGPGRQTWPRTDPGQGTVAAAEEEQIAAEREDVAAEEEQIADEQSTVVAAELEDKAPMDGRFWKARPLVRHEPAVIARVESRCPAFLEATVINSRFESW